MAKMGHSVCLPVRRPGARACMCANLPLRTFIVWVILLVAAGSVAGELLASGTITDLR